LPYKTHGNTNQQPKSIIFDKRQSAEKDVGTSKPVASQFMGNRLNNMNKKSKRSSFSVQNKKFRNVGNKALTSGNVFDNILERPFLAERKKNLENSISTI